MNNFTLTSVLDVVEKAVSEKKSENLKRHQQEFIEYNPQDNNSIVFEPTESSSASLGMDKVLRLPYSYFMSIEYCILPKEQPQQYHLCTYVPSNMPVKNKCGVFKSCKEDHVLHRHDYFELIYVYKGKRVMQVEDEKIILHEKDICIFDMQCAHLDIRMDSEGIAFYCCFTSKLVDSYFLRCLTNKRIREFFLAKGEQKTDVSYMKLTPDPKATEALEKNFAEIFEEMETSEIGWERMAQICTLRSMNRFPTNVTPDVVVFSKRLQGTKLYHAVAKFISSNIADISLEKLCEQFHYQADYYNRLIKKNSGLTYSEYVRSLRMEKAKNLLINTDMSIQSIVLLLGYQCYSYFYKAFQKENGMTPMEYRRRHQ
ncbi:MAG TPA: AraC family transcriptional regulator [Clostridiales bacterium]|nr:AraC family transcriptional regulator [Clostridiales bacterium]